MVAAKNAVAMPTIATNSSAKAECRNSCELRAIMYTPAVTMVAAWISALTGVGPAMASGSQTYKGICADFPVAPSRSSRQMAVIQPGVDSTGRSLACENTLPKSSEPKCIAIRNTASENPKSPMRFTMNALLPASVAYFSRK